MKVNYKDATIELDFLDEYYGVTVEHPDSDVIYAIHEEFGGHLDDYEFPINIRFSSTDIGRLENYLVKIKDCIDLHTLYNNNVAWRLLTSTFK